MSRDLALAAIDDYYQNGTFEAELASRISYKTESNLPNSDAALEAYLDDDLVPYLSDMGFTCRVYPNPRSDAGPFCPWVIRVKAGSRHHISFACYSDVIKTMLI